MKFENPPKMIHLPLRTILSHHHNTFNGLVRNWNAASCVSLYFSPALAHRIIAINSLLPPSVMPTASTSFLTTPECYFGVRTLSFYDR
jgi:hypothetical protein